MLLERGQSLEDMSWRNVMCNVLKVALFVLTMMMASVVDAEIIVRSIASPEEVTNDYAVPPGQYMVIALPGSGGPKTGYRINISSNNAIYRDITAFLVDAANLSLFKSGQQFQGLGFQKKVAPFTISEETKTLGQYYLILDNSYARLIQKKLRVSIKAAIQMDSSAQQAMKTTMGNFYAALKKGLVFPDFNIYIEPCGQTNAFSETFGSGAIHICTEIIDNLNKANNKGAFTFILLHELGHSVLGLWGVPGNNNEDLADEFATYFLMQNDASIRMLEQSLDFWRNRDSMSEARNMIIEGDRHSLSIQRVRNIQENMKRGDEFIKRWDRAIYPHMTSEALSEIVSHPKSYSDVGLAKQVLKDRTNVN